MAELQIFDSTFYNLQRAMDNASKRQAILAHNMANANTPGYDAMDFDAVLGEAVKRADGRGVVIEEEMASLTENSVMYSAYVKLLSSKLSTLRSIATQGRK
jgi:flagellar basal body rod protein FlgB